MKETLKTKRIYVQPQIAMIKMESSCGILAGSDTKITGDHTPAIKGETPQIDEDEDLYGYGSN